MRKTDVKASRSPCAVADRSRPRQCRSRRAATAAAATAGAAGHPEAADQPEISAGEIQRLYDAYALVQAQEALQLSDDQYVRFVARLKTLQETRRRHQQARNQIVQDLRRLTNPQTGTGRRCGDPRAAERAESGGRTRRCRAAKGPRRRRRDPQRPSAGPLPALRGSDGAPQARPPHARATERPQPGPPRPRRDRVTLR